MKVLSAVSATIVATVATAFTVSEISLPGLSNDKARIGIEDIALDATRSFEKIDVDGSNYIDVNEYAAQAIVLARLARQHGVVSVDGQAKSYIELETVPVSTLTPQEETRIDAIARREFYKRASDKKGLSLADWQEDRMYRFSKFDRNRDDALSGSEKSQYAQSVAFLKSIRA